VGRPDRSPKLSADTLCEVLHQPYVTFHASNGPRSGNAVSIEFEADRDVDALVRAREKIAGSEIEVRQKKRLVGHRRGAAHRKRCPAEAGLRGTKATVEDTRSARFVPVQIAKAPRRQSVPSEGLRMSYDCLDLTPGLKRRSPILVLLSGRPWGRVIVCEVCGMLPREGKSASRRSN
jgi:hypothetical protein